VSDAQPTAPIPADAHSHLENITANLQLVADLGYGDAALAWLEDDGGLTVLADARPATAMDPFPLSRGGERLAPNEEPEAYAAVERRQPVLGTARRGHGGVTRTTDAYPVGAPQPYAVILRTYGEQIEATASRMETAFIDAARDLMQTLRDGPLVETRTGLPFATERRAGDGVLRVSGRGEITYASPNAVSIMRNAGVEGRVTGMRAAELPGGAVGISPLLGGCGALATELEVGDRTLGYRSLALTAGLLVLVEDLTEARRRERELGIKEATIREVHHRVKNNLQTIASLLRMQARRSDSPEVRRALTEATERAASMATVHDLLAHSDHERVDFAEATRRVVDLVRSGVLSADQDITVSVSGSTGPISAGEATSLALALTELVHNALEHAFEPGQSGTVEVDLVRDGDDLAITVRDDGRGLPEGFDVGTSRGLGFSIVRTLVEEDLRGSLSATSEGGATVVVRVPLLELRD
jgi:two-component system, sensor histidine kinase PdtaS